MPQNVIEVDLARTGGLLPTGQVSADKVEAVISGRPAPAPAEPGPAPARPEVEGAEHTAPPAVCKHCSMPADLEPDTPTDDDVYAFSQAVWRDARFTKTFELFGAAVSVTFRTLTADEEMYVEAAVDRERLDGKLPDAYAAMVRLGELRLPLAIAKLRVGGYIMDRVIPDPLDWDLALEFTLIRKGPLKNVPVVNAVGAEYRRFFRIADALGRRALDKSFWQAADRAGYSHASPPPATQG